MNPYPSPRTADYLLFPLLYFCGMKLGAYSAMMPEGTTFALPASAVLLAFLIIFNGRGYYIWGLVALLVHGVVDWNRLGVQETLLLGVTNVFEASLAFTLLSMWNFDRRLNSFTDLPVFIIAGPLAASGVAALATTVIHTEIFNHPSAYLEFFRDTWVARALGLMVLTPILLAFLHPEPSDLPATNQKLRSDYFAFVIAAIIVTLLLKAESGQIFGMHIGPILLLPLLLYASVRSGLRLTSVTIAALTLLTVTLTIAGSNPLGVVKPANTVIETQIFLLTVCVMALGLSTLILQVRYRHFRLEQTNKSLNECNSKLKSGLEKSTSRLESAKEEIERLSLTDLTTELLNWRGFLDLALHEMSRSTRHNQSVSLVAMDIDNFKSVNEKYGHDIGDEILKEVANVLKQAIRTCDIAACFGGEEFIVLAPNTNLQQAKILAERIRSALKQGDFHYGDNFLTITASFGIAESKGKEHFDKLSQRADRCLKKAKKRGRNCVVTEQDQQSKTQKGTWAGSATPFSGNGGQPV